MGSVKLFLKGLKAAAARLAMLLVLHGLSPGAGWAQESAAPKFDEELAKQERIYHSPSGSVPSGYITSRALSDYVALLPSGFCNTLARLGSADRWLDIGAGKGDAILDYYNRTKCRRPGVKARAVAMSIEDRRTDKWRERAASVGDDRIRYLSGRRLRQYSPEELGKFQFITDVFGGFSYTENLSGFVQQVLGMLETGGVFYTLMSGVHLSEGKEKLGILYLTELEDAIGRPVKLCSWLEKTTCAQVTCESKQDWKRPTELIKIAKVCSDTSVPSMKLVEFEAGYPPSRRFQLEQ